MKYLLLFVGLAFVFSCKLATNNSSEIAQASFSTNETKEISKQFADYWYSGKAELNRYELSQNRYGENHPGEMIMIFVTEDFLPGKHVKNDNYKEKKSISILKNNVIRKFNTGIYDYSMMSSVFTPINRKQYPQTLKTTCTSQDWCGHTFQQLNWRGKKYEVESRSYFEAEGDEDYHISSAILEDELFNLIRLNPEALPFGTLEMIPSAQISRLMHIKTMPYKANASLKEYNENEFEGRNLKIYSVEIPDISRSLEIVYENEFPYKIVGWKDSYPSMFSNEIRTTIAKRTHERYSSYWQENSKDQMELRSSLGR